MFYKMLKKFNKIFCSMNFSFFSKIFQFFKKNGLLKVLFRKPLVATQVSTNSIIIKKKTYLQSSLIILVGVMITTLFIGSGLISLNVMLTDKDNNSLAIDFKECENIIDYYKELENLKKKLTLLLETQDKIISNNYNVENNDVKEKKEILLSIIDNQPIFFGVKRSVIVEKMELIFSLFDIYNEYNIHNYYVKYNAIKQSLFSLFLYVFFDIKYFFSEDFKKHLNEKDKCIAILRKQNCNNNVIDDTAFHNCFLKGIEKHFLELQDMLYSGNFFYNKKIFEENFEIYKKAYISYMKYNIFHIRYHNISNNINFINNRISFYTKRIEIAQKKESFNNSLKRDKIEYEKV